MIYELRLRILQQWRLLLPVTLLAMVLSRDALVLLHAAGGDLDPTFGNAGSVTIDFSYREGGVDYWMNDRVHAVAIQPDGKIVAAGTAHPGGGFGNVAVVRTNPDGSLDPTFGNGGLVLAELPELSSHKARALLIQPDGKILVGGNASGSFLVVRYNGDGSLDNSFGDGGLVLTKFGNSFSDVLEALALQSDGQIVAVGTSDRDVALARYNPDGSLDPTFGTDGRVVTALGTGGAGVADVAVQADGRILVAGIWASNVLLARYDADGSLDTTFSDDGIVSTNVAGKDEAYGMVLQADGRILVAGETLDVAGRTDFTLARYNADGTLDTMFGVGGLVMTDFGGANDGARDLALQADGGIVVVGPSFLAGDPTNRNIAVGRYDSNGMLDPTFGVGGLMTTDVAGASDSANAVAIQADGKIVVAGNTFSGQELGKWNFVIVRYDSGGIEPPAPRPNVLLITVDDLNWDSLGVTGNPIPGISPHVDRLASEGMIFERAHVTVAICHPSRAVWLTGRYPQNSGALGFEEIDAGVPTLVETMAGAGYYTGLMAKTGHVVPSRAAAWDELVPGRELKNGRSPQLYYTHAERFFERAKAAGKPFFLMANTQDPHRPFAASQQEVEFKARDASRKDPQYGGGFPPASLAYAPSEVPVPGFLPDLPPIRRELAEYYTSVHRADETTGALLQALDRAGLTGSTLVMWLSDHGMALPFAKTNVWWNSTRTPWIVRWPGVVAAGSRDAQHFVSGIDLAPTILEAVGLQNLDGADGRSFLALLRGDTQTGREQVFTQIDELSSGRAYPMRAVMDGRFGYIFNAWADGQTKFRNESMSGLTFAAMQEAAASDTAIAARVTHFVYRTPEELYDYQRDPNALRNLIDDPSHQQTVARYRALLLDHMKESADPQQAAFERFLAGAALPTVTNEAR